MKWELKFLHESSSELQEIEIIINFPSIRSCCPLSPAIETVSFLHFRFFWFHSLQSHLAIHAKLNISKCSLQFCT
jgi:hypothetical protein